MSQPQLSIMIQDREANKSSIPLAISPLVIVGNGPVRMYAARELLQRKPDANIVIYGNEHHQPYNRVKLYHLLSGELDWESLLEKLKVSDTAIVEERIGYNITHINTKERFIEDHQEIRQPYDKLIHAIGSRPHIPNIPDVNREVVFTFRNLDNVNQLLACRVRSQYIVILGGSLLGLEAARGMQRNKTYVTVVEHNALELNND